MARLSTWSTAPPRPRRGGHRDGVAACLISAACFGALPVLGKQAYQAGIGPLGLLWARFGVAAIVFWVLVGAVVRPPRPSARFLAAGLLMGFSGYAVEATLFFLALERIDASLTELLLYGYPVMVTVAALALGRESTSPRLVCALSLASAGILLVFAGSLASGVNPLGLALGLGSAVVYATYVLAGERVVAVVHPVLLAALICTGAAAFFTLARLAGGSLVVPATAEAWDWVGLIAVVATVVPMVALFVGIERVGAATASIVSTFEPVVTVVLAALFLGEHLSAVEALGAAAVLAAVRLLQTRPTSASTEASGSPPALVGGAVAGE
jgi:drug/metabolite transporter (DMT)-like permease